MEIVSGRQPKETPDTTHNFTIAACAFIKRRNSNRVVGVNDDAFIPP